MQRDALWVKLAIQVHSREDVLEGWNDVLHGGDVLLLKGWKSRSGGYNGLSGRFSNGVRSGLGGGLRGRRGHPGSREGQ